MAPEGNTLAYAAQDSSGHLAPFKINRREVGSDDVQLKITHCGICHSDLHQIKNEWKNSSYPVVPGHELTGIVTKVGGNVTKFKVGDHVGVGCLVRSCHSCDACNADLQQFCQKCVFTYNGTDADGSTTYGGYSSQMVCDEKFVLRIPDNLPLDAAAPLLCAGITVYSPMVYYKMNEPGKTFGVVGLGGLGHMAVKFGKAFGMKVVVFSTSPKKEKEAKEVLGADEFVVTKDEEAMKAYAGKVDYMIDTVSAHHELAQYLPLLKVNGKMILVGAPPDALSLSSMMLIFGRKLVGGSLIGGVQETQDMLDFCGKHNITSMIEKIPIDYVNTAMERLVKADVQYRFVIDIEGSLKE